RVRPALDVPWPLGTASYLPESRASARLPSSNKPRPAPRQNLHFLTRSLRVARVQKLRVFFEAVPLRFLTHVYAIRRVFAPVGANALVSARIRSKLSASNASAAAVSGPANWAIT